MPTITIQEDIIAEFTAEPITKIIVEPGQGGINILEAELTEQVVKIETTKDLVDKEDSYGFLALVLGQTLHGKVV